MIALEVSQLTPLPPKGSRPRWTFDVRVDAGVVVTVRHCLASRSHDGDILVRMPEDRQGSPLVKLPTAWIKAMIVEVERLVGGRQETHHA